MVHFNAINVQCKVSIEPLFICHYAKLLRLSLKLILKAGQGEWILTEFRIITDNQKVFYAQHNYIRVLSRGAIIRFRTKALLPA